MTVTEEFVNFYEILPGVVETSDQEVIRKAIREQRQIWNKRAAQANPAKREHAQKRIRELGEAERVLLDPAKKREFDQRARQYRPQENQAPSHAGESGRDWLGLAREYFERGNAPSAYYAAREAIAVNGANHEAWSIRANSSFLMGNFQDAGFEFRETISLKPDSPEYHFDYAEAFAAAGALREALGEYETALRLAPGNPLYRTAIANVYLKQGESEKALSLMEDVVKEFPDVPGFQYYLALAIEAVQLNKWSRLHSGRYVITSPAQIDVTREMSGRALKLKFDDEPLRRSLKENLELADKAAEVRWFHSNVGPWLIALLIAFGITSANPAGILLIIAVIGLYTVTHRMPVWKHNSKAMGIARRGI
ncbi:tetratricopeptide repeat protein [Blastococcus sp. SYSU DS1021]